MIDCFIIFTKTGGDKCLSRRLMIKLYVFLVYDSTGPCTLNINSCFLRKNFITLASTVVRLELIQQNVAEWGIENTEYSCINDSDLIISRIRMISHDFSVILHLKLIIK